ncbi:MAG: hypothetical protein AAB393_12490 [Bacteroidota bacterium]
MTKKHPERSPAQRGEVEELALSAAEGMRWGQRSPHSPHPSTTARVLLSEAEASRASAQSASVLVIRI